MKPDIRFFDLPDSNCYFHPSITPLPDSSWLLTAQTILGEDHYGEPVFSRSADRGGTWEPFAPIPPFANREIGKGWLEGVADVRPFCFGTHGEIFFFGCTSVYTPKGNACYQKEIESQLPPVRAVCAVLHPDGSWSSQELKLPVATEDWRTTCIQPVFCPPDRVLLPFHFATGTCIFSGQPALRFGVASARYEIRSDALKFEEMGNILNLAAGRGLLEPSLIRLSSGKIALTIRAEDGHGYATVSEDGLHWLTPRPWCWEDGTPLEMSSTQQHWIRLGSKAYLIYTRKDAANQHIFRSRAPLYLAEAQPEKGILLRETEQIVFPRQIRDGIEALYGNFHAAQLNENNAVITDAALFINKKRETRMMGVTVSIRKGKQ